MAKKKATAVAEKDTSGMSRLARLRKEIQADKDARAFIANGEFEPKLVIPSGSIALDKSLQIGGFAFGHIYELYGDPSAGKSTLAMKAAGNCQRMGYPVLYINFERTYDSMYAQRLGMLTDEDSLLLIEPESLEQGYREAYRFMSSGTYGMVIVDSVAAMTSQEEYDKDITDTPPMTARAKNHSRLISYILERINTSKTAFLFINHLSRTIGLYATETTPGGRALKFYSSTRIRLAPDNKSRVTGPVYDPISGTQVVETIMLPVAYSITKNKLGPIINTKGTLYLRYNKGFSDADEVFEIAVARGIVRKTGNRFYFDLFINEKTGNPVNFPGRESAVQWLQANDAEYNMLRARVLEAIETPLEGYVLPEILEDESPLTLEDVLPDFVDDEETAEIKSFLEGGLVVERAYGG